MPTNRPMPEKAATHGFPPCAAKMSTAIVCACLAAWVLLFENPVRCQGHAPPTVWHDPAKAGIPVVDGRGWQTGLANPFDRLPSKAEAMVRPPVWNLSRNGSGLHIAFRTDAGEITVRYAVAGALSMPHMPSTGVSGLDLYARNGDAGWTWAKAAYRFADTVVYRYANLSVGKDAEFRLYLPLYNTVKWLEIGVPAGKRLEFLPAAAEKPIVAYGTSIMQGGCASRPGLSWTSILGRRIGMPIVNLGFSGNGQLEEPVVRLLCEIDARMFILDCLPNLADRNKFPAAELERRMRMTVGLIRQAYPATPILLAEHCCGIPGTNLDSSLTTRYAAVNDMASVIYGKMIDEGITGIYLLRDTEIAFDMECTVDGTHPNDIGMMRYAEAYEKAIRRILSALPAGTLK